MFTGIITHIGILKEFNLDQNKDAKIAILLLGKTNRSLEIGCSIACNGICLTLVERKDNLLFFNISNETVKKTNVGNWKIEQKINLEFSLRIGDELGGHLVLGHVDGCAKLVEKNSINDSVKMDFIFENSNQLINLIAKKGSVCLDGISLTVNEVDDKIFSVNIIKHTLENTALNDIKINDLVNVEIDMMMRYLQRLNKK